MRWIDIPLPSSGVCPAYDRHRQQAAALAAEIPRLQAREGLDSRVVVRQMRDIGQAMFQAVTAHDRAAFRDDSEAAPTGTAESDCLVGYHLVADREQEPLPWLWLHNGVEFLLARHPLCVAGHGSRVPDLDPTRLWMHRYSDELFSGSRRHAASVDEEGAIPEVLFVPGHGNDEIRRLMFREADGIDSALRGAPRQAARLRIPGAITPSLLASRAMLYQALHFTSPTSQAPEVSGAGEQRWLSSLIAPPETAGDAGFEEMVGLDLEVVGIDPVEALLDQVSERVESRASSQPRRELVAAARLGTASPRSTWLLDDGPVEPESLGRDGALPPLVFSNSYCSLRELGQRFLAAGTSTFVGPAVPLFSRPARRFAANFYGFLAQGLCAAAAVRASALTLRDELGEEHPAWLTYGLLGYGSLALRHL